MIEVKYNTKRKVKGKGFVEKEIVHKRDVTVPTWPEFVNYILHTSDSKDVMICDDSTNDTHKSFSYLFLGPPLGELHQALLALRLQLHVHRAPGGRGGGGAGAVPHGAGPGGGRGEDHEPHHGRRHGAETGGVHRHAGLSPGAGPGEAILGRPGALPV